MKTKHYFLSLAIACLLLFSGTAKAQLIIYEPASGLVAGGTNLTTDSYALSATNPDPDGGLNSGTGFPASNSITPADISTGLRGTWNTNITVVSGLTYNNAGGTLSTTGNALKMNTGAGAGTSMYPYTIAASSDPFASYRSTANANLFGWNTTSGAKTLYFSVLLNLSTFSGVKVFGMGANGGSDILIGSIGGTNQWQVKYFNATSNLGAGVAGTTAFIVGKIEFLTATSTKMSFWLNPALNADMSTLNPQATNTNASAAALTYVYLRSDAANTLTADEFRMGTTAADVMPATAASAPPAAPTALVTSAVTDNTLTLDWTASATSGVTYEIYKGGVSIGSVGTGITTYNVTGLTAGTVYAFTVKALKDAVYSDASTAANQRTTNSGVTELIVYEGANYTLDETNSDPDGGINSGNGMPASGVISTSTGLRGSWGTDIKVVTGLTYSNSGRTLTTSGNALTQTTNDWAVNPLYVYKTPTETDPFLAFRGDANANLFGYKAATGAASFYFSVLMKVSALNQGTNYFSIQGNNTLLIGQSAGDQWTINGKNIGAAVVDETALIVGRIIFGNGTTSYEYWLNPALSANQTLGTPANTDVVASTTSVAFAQFRSVANTLRVDELRIGLKVSDVLPSSISTSLNNVSLSVPVYQSESNIIVDLNGLSGAQTVSIVDVQGRNIMTRQTVGGTKLTIANNLKNGVYVLKVQGIGNPYITKLVVRQ